MLKILTCKLICDYSIIIHMPRHIKRHKNDVFILMNKARQQSMTP
jgi:hypothetical protein